MLHLENQIEAPHTSSAADMLQENMECYGMSSEELANRIGVSTQYIDNVLHRKEYLDRETAFKAEKVFGISSTMLLRLDDAYKKAHTSQAKDKQLIKLEPLTLG